MKINLKHDDMSALKVIVDSSNLNRKVMDAYSFLLTQKPDIITSDMINSVVNSSGVDTKYAYYVLLSSVFGLDITNVEGRMMGEKYILPSLNHLNVSDYYNYPFYKDIDFTNIVGDKWELKYETLKPYEMFVYNDIECKDNYVEIPRMGFFSEEYKYPAVLENGNEWMTLLPNEIESMKADINKVSGNVVTFGLGLGCYAYMVSLKDNVESVTIVEKSQEVIDMFTTHILPQFKYKNKVKVIKSDAFDFVKNNMSSTHFDYAFVDIWHDISDGVDLYTEFKRYEKYAKNTKFLYWIEDLMISYIRWYVFDGILAEMMLEGSGNFSKDIDNITINSIDDIHKLLSDEGIRNIAKYIDKPLFQEK